MPAAPTMQHQTRCAKKVFNPIADGMASTNTKSGGQSAVCTAWCGWVER